MKDKTKVGIVMTISPQKEILPDYLAIHFRVKKMKVQI